MKKKYWKQGGTALAAASIVLATGTLVGISAPSAYARGIGVGNGGQDSRAAYIERLKREMGQAVDDADAGVPALSEWCDRASAILTRELKRAQVAAAAERYDLGWQILQDALTAIGQSIQVDPDLGGPLTKTLVDRGLWIAAALDETVPSSNLQVSISKLNFMIDYVQFIISMESYLDQPLYLDYRYTHGTCGGRCPKEFRFADFQRRYLDYAARQLRFVANDLTDVVMVNGRPEARPVGDARVFLKAAELTAGFVARDVASNLFAYSQSCTVADLQSLSLVLRDYNNLGDRTVYQGNRIAVAEAYDEMTRAANRLVSNPSYCR